MLKTLEKQMWRPMSPNWLMLKKKKTRKKNKKKERKINLLVFRKTPLQMHFIFMPLILPTCRLNFSCHPYRQWHMPCWRKYIFLVNLSLLLVLTKYFIAQWQKTISRQPKTSAKPTGFQQGSVNIIQYQNWPSHDLGHFPSFYLNTR